MKLDDTALLQLLPLNQNNANYKLNHITRAALLKDVRVGGTSGGLQVNLTLFPQSKSEARTYLKKPLALNKIHLQRI